PPVTDEDDAEERLGVELLAGQDAQLVQDGREHFLGLVDDEHGPRHRGGDVLTPALPERLETTPADRRQLFLQVNDNYSCRSSPGGWTPAATMLTPGGGDDGERGSHLHGSGLVGGRRALLGLFGADALTVELEDDRVVDDAVDGGGGGHGILEDAV